MKPSFFDEEQNQAAKHDSQRVGRYAIGMNPSCFRAPTAATMEPYHQACVVQSRRRAAISWRIGA
jgi:hypothetical protein